VQSAAPGSKWTGGAARAYGTANANHGDVFVKLAGLDQRLSAQVNQSSQVVDAGRRNLDAVRQWVIDAAASVPPGKNRDQMLLPIVQKGLSQLTEIVTKSNGDLGKIGGEIRSLDSEFKALGNQQFGPKEGTRDDVLGVKGDDEDKKKEEEEKRKKDVEEGLENGHDDGESLADGQLSPEESKRLRDATTLTPGEKSALDRGDLTLPPERMAYNLPTSIREIFDAPLQNDPTGDWITTPNGEKIHIPPDYNEPYKFLDEYRDIAAISNYGDHDLQRGSAINDGLMAESRELLEHFESDKWPNYDNSWGHQNLDPALQEIMSAASHDPVAVHDAIAGVDGRSPNNDFIGDVYQHDWADDGKAAGQLFPDTLDHSERAGQTMYAFGAYAGEHYQDLLNMSGSDSLGQVNPELVCALGDANVPYIDDMAGSNIDGTKGFGKLDSGANANNMRGLFAVNDSDETVGNNFNANASNVSKEYVADYSQGLAHGGIPDGDLLKSVGKLRGAMDMGEYIHQLDSGKDEYEASKAAWDKKGEWYDAIHDTASEIPRLKEAVGVYDKIPGDPLRQLFVGETPTPGTQTPMPLRDMDDITKTVAHYLVHENIGDLTNLQDFIGPDGELQSDKDGAQSRIEDYLSNVAGNNEFPYLKWSDAYQAAIYVSEGEFDKIKPPEG
jgi:hypothetical protein